jgi:hypothetical protein
MGTRKSNDSVRTSVRADRKQIANSVRENESLADPPAFLPNSFGPVDEELARELVQLMLRLRVIYCTALATELALRQQNAEQDVDLAQCLRSNVCGAIIDIQEQVQALVKRLGGEVPETLP